uniref:HEAT repeat domain-containing protein n=1 Tax=Heterorhabditis bacteriophora TaxID=37862 RepID=A0A1I7XJ46_HETBA
MLKKLEVEIVTLDDLFRLVGNISTIPNISNVLTDIGADQELQEIWLSTCYPLNTTLVVPKEELRTQIKLNIAHIIEPNYPHLVNRVADSILRLMVDSVHDESKLITVFHFVGIFKGRHFAPYVENLGHDAWMVTLLDTRQSSKVVQVVDRLSNVPIVPPLESLKHLGLLLTPDEDKNKVMIERYLSSARGHLLSDLLSSYLCLLEADEESSRIGAIRALDILKNTRIARQVSYVAEHDSSNSVRNEAAKLLQKISNFNAKSKIEDDEITRI